MTVKELAEKFNLTSVAIPCPEKEISGAYIGDLLSWVMGKAESGNAWITIMSNVNILAVASLSDVSCIILAEGVVLEEEIIATANAKLINVLSSPKSAFDIAKMLSGAI